MSQNFTKKLCVMTLKNDKKFAEDFTFCLKSDMRNLKNFDKNTQKS